MEIQVPKGNCEKNTLPEQNEYCHFSLPVPLPTLQGRYIHFLQSWASCSDIEVIQSTHKSTLTTKVTTGVFRGPLR